MEKLIYVQAETLTPFHYNHLPIAGGNSTLPQVLTDSCVMFGLANAMGKLSRLPVLPQKPNFKKDIGNLPIKSSLFKRIPVNGIPDLMEPLAQRFSISDEFTKWEEYRKSKKLAASGMFKEFFYIQQVPPGSVYLGALYGINPFEILNTDEIIIRIGINRCGMLKIKKADGPCPIHLNAFTAGLFTNSEFFIENDILGRIKETQQLSEEDFIKEVSQWK